jgi:hypothetical protein
VAVVRSGTQHTLYVNGKAVGSQVSDQIVRHHNSLEMRLGARYSPQGDAADSVLQGQLDEARFWPRAVSGRELVSASKAQRDGR